MHLLTFRTNYLKNTLYVLGNYTFLSGSSMQPFLSLFFTRHSAGQTTAPVPVGTDVVVENIRGSEQFSLEAHTGRHRGIIYTAIPFESFVYWRRLRIRQRTVLIHLGGLLVVFRAQSIRARNGILSMDVPYRDRCMGLGRALELLVNEHLDAVRLNGSPDDDDIMEHNIGCSTLQGLGALIDNGEFVEFYKVSSNCPDPIHDLQTVPNEILRLLEFLERASPLFVKPVDHDHGRREEKRSGLRPKCMLMGPNKSTLQ